MRANVAIRGVFYLTAAMMPGAAHAQDGSAEAGGPQLDDIVVTAQKREENIQKVPVAISAISGEALVSRGVANIEDLGRTVPGTQVGVSSGVVVPFIRGVGNTAIGIGNESSVAIYVDGVYFSRVPAGVFQLRNVQRVEVLKGPQGTLFGRNASAGVIQVLTRDPSHDTAISGSAGYGRFDTFEGNLYATTGLSDKAAIDIALSGRYQGKGWGKNLVSHAKTNYYNDFSARSKLLVDLGETTRVSLTGFYSHSDASQQGNTLPGTTRGFQSLPLAQNPGLPFYDQDSDQPAPMRSDVYGGSLKIEQELGFANLTSITAYIYTVNDYTTDGDYGPRPDQVVRFGGPVKQFTQELQLASRKGSALDWTLGAFYFNTVNRYDGRTLFTSPSGALAVFGPNGRNALAESHPKSYALFGQASYEVLPSLRLTGGLRYTWDRQTASGEFRDGPGGPVTRTFPDSKQKLNKLTYRAGLDYRLNDDTLVYASTSRGFKSAVYNLLTYNPVPNKAEVLTSYEGGLKTDLFDHRLRINAAAYHYILRNPQVALVLNGSIQFSNADSAHINGAEMEAEAAIGKGLKARLSAAYTDAKYVRYPNAPTGVLAATGGPLTSVPFGSLSPLRLVDAKGNNLPFAPNWTVNAGADYELNTSSGTWTLSADAFYNGNFFTEPDNFIRQKSFVIVNAQIKYAPSDNIAVRLWGKNLANEKYILRAVTQSGPAGFPYSPAAPLTYGIAFDFSF